MRWEVWEVCEVGGVLVPSSFTQSLEGKRKLLEKEKELASLRYAACCKNT